MTDATSGTSDFLSKQVEDAKHNLDDLDSKLAAFKKRYMGQLPGDEDNNLKILMGLNSQLDANTQTLNRAQQDKVLHRIVAGAAGGGVEELARFGQQPQTLQQQLAQLQAQLIELQARYTDDHPDVIKTKADIAEVKKKLEEMKNASATRAATTPDDKRPRPSLRRFGSCGCRCISTRI